MTERIAATFGTIAVMLTLAACGATQWFGKLAHRLPTAPFTVAHASGRDEK